MSNKSRTFLVEGQTERHLIRCLSSCGRVLVHNLWEQPVTKHLRKWTDTEIYVVCDTDVVGNQNMLHRNLRTLMKGRLLVGVLQQTFNLEDELARACGVKPAALFQHFQASSSDEFKTRFLRVSDPLAKLEQLNFDLNLLWCQTPHPVLSNYAHLFKTWQDLQPY